MLGKLVENRINERGVSVREAADELGVSHTTVRSVIAGKPTKFDILQTIAEWLDIDFTTAMGMYDKDPIANKISALMKADPRLGKVLTEMIEDYEAGNLSKEDVDDIINYASFRMERPIHR